MNLFCCLCSLQRLKLISKSFQEMEDYQKIPFYVKTVIPQVVILQEQFDFGKLTTLGNEGSLKMTLFNMSSIAAELTLNLDKDSLEAPDGIECLKIQPVDDLDKSVLKSIHEEKDENQEQSDSDNMNSDAGSEHSEEDLDQIKSKKYSLTIQGNSKLEFYLKFSPRDVKTYTFELPILLNRYGRLPGLTKQVICRGLKPRFVMDPQQIEFPRKIITSMEKLFPTTVEITLSNPERKTVQWRMDINNLLPERIFNIYPTEGKIDSGQTVKLKAQFNPNKADFFHKSVPVFIDSQDNSYLELILKGTAAQPKIQFDRREVLLPCVPLNVEASCTFRILNDGYENLNLRHKVYGEEGNINIHLRFPEGNNIGMSKKRLRVDALFQSSKPLSFTTRIEFYDEVGKVYTIPVSGTADNCLLSNYSYLQRQQGYFRIEEKQPQGPLMLVEDDQDNGNDDNLRKAQSMVSYRTFSSLSGRSVTSALGYSPIPQDLVEQNKQYATKCLKFFLWSTNIHSFPDGIIEQDGLPIFELISLFSNRPMPLPCQQFLEKGSKKLERVGQLLKMYDELIRMLKSEGALLNHIRPYHLLSFNDLNASFKLMSPEELDLIHPNVLKITQQRYNYISIDSWCSLFHQVLKIYMLSRINHKFFRTIPGIPNDKNNLNDSYVVGSNLYSPQEGMLMRWLEVFLESYNSQQNLPPPQRIKSLNQLKDGLHLSAVLYYYVGNSVQKFIKDLKQDCLTELDYKFNIQKILQVFSEIRFSIPLDLTGLVQPSGREMVIFMMHLFNQIPHYLPKGTETFSCVLGQQVTRTILLSNRTNKPISYWVKLEKDEDFKSESGDAIRLEPGVLNFPFKIKFLSRVSQPVYDRITFMSKRDNNAFTGAIVYDLKSQITGRESKSVESITTQLYEQKDFSIQIQNDFFKSDFGNFTIKLIHERIVEQPKKKNKLYQEKEKQPDVFPAIFCRLDTIRLKRNSPYQLQLQYIPLVMETQRCYIVFTDPLVGEFQHEIIANPDPPDIYGDPKTYQVYVDQQQIIDLQVAPRNELLLRARKSIEQLLAEGKNPKKISAYPGGEPEITLFDIELTQHFGYLSIPKQLTVHDLQRQKQNRQLREKQEKLEKEKIQQEAGGEKQNQITQASQNKKLDSSQVFSMNQSFLGADMANTSNKLPITFMFKNPIREMPVTITLKSQDKTDVRRIKLLITSLPKPTKASLEVKCPAREVVVQDIPLVNNSDRDWTIKFVLTQDGAPNNQLFQLTNVPLVTSKDQHEHGAENKFVMGGYKDQVVKKKQRLDVKLQFSPKWICHTEGHLTITNTTTSDIYDYNLSGTGEEPLASSNIVMKCQARAQNKTEIVLYNHSNNVLKYRVETDLINASGLTQFTIQPLKKYRYELIVMPMLSGQYNGQITFYEESGEYVWYTVVLDTDSPQAEKEIDIITQARKPVAFDIEISNPMPDEQATFEVSVQGEHLLGAKYFTVLPQSSSIYELIYLPHIPEKKKAQIGFIHYKLGEIWYNLNLISEDKQAHRTPVLRAELGKVEEHEVLLDNPTGKEIEVETIISNMANFDVLPPNIVLAPYEQTRVFIRYIPSSLDQVQQGDITFKTKEIGKWDYIVYGLGIPPTVFSETTVTIGINKDYSDVINFKNPFKETIQVTIQLESEDQACLEAFQLLLKKKTEQKTTIQGLQSLQIPFSFTPRQIRSYRCELVIAMNEKIKWRYPLVGHTESFATGRFTQFKTKCRIQFIQDFKFQLPGAGQSSNFTFELKNIQENCKLLVDKFFKLKMMTNQIQQDDELVFEALFNPLKPFKTNFDLIIKRESGGVWKFPLFLEATQPDIDDLIVISSPLGKQSSVAFRLTNRNKSLAAFNAYFLPTSDQEFTVSPKQGLLEPNGREGNLFVIKFTPLEYGQIRQGILVIETDDMYWSYKVKGTLPKYDPPVGQTKIDTHINVGQTFKPRNILQANIKKSQSPNQKKSQWRQLHLKILNHCNS
ncbi:Encoded by [Paramecium bursaria]